MTKKIINLEEYKFKRDNPSLLYEITEEEFLEQSILTEKNKEKKNNVIYIKPKTKRRRPKK